MSKFEAYYELARKLYLEGKTLEEIKDQLDVSVTTLSKWKNDGEWEKDRAKQRQRKLSTEERLAVILERKLQQLEEMSAEEINSKHTDQIAKISKTIENLRTKRDPMGATILVMEEFVSWLQQKNQTAWDAISPHISEFFEYMRTKNGQI